MVPRDRFGDRLVDGAHLRTEIDEGLLGGAERCRQLEDRGWGDVGADDIEPVAEPDRFDLVDIADQHQEFEFGLIQDFEQIVVADRGALVDDQQVEAAAGLSVLACNRTELRVWCGHASAEVFDGGVGVGEE